MGGTTNTFIFIILMRVFVQVLQISTGLQTRFVNETFQNSYSSSTPDALPQIQLVIEKQSR